MQEIKVESLYKDIIEYSWDNTIDDYDGLIRKCAKKYEFDENGLELIIDKVLKKILTNLKNNVPEDKYMNIIFNLGPYNDQDALDFTIGLILSYYRDNFIIEGKEYSVYDMMYTVYNQYKTKETLPFEKILHYMLADLLRIHHMLYIREQNLKNKN